MNFNIILIFINKLYLISKKYKQTNYYYLLYTILIVYKTKKT